MILRALPATQCPSCRDHLAAAPPVAPCPACSALHHAACLAELGCSSLVCGVVGAIEPAEDDEDEQTENPLLGVQWYAYDGATGDYQIPYYGSHDGDAVGLANEQTVDAEFGDCSFVDGHGRFTVDDTPCECGRGAEDPWACELSMVETLNALECYPILDEDLHSQIEQDQQTDAWEDWGRAEMETEASTRWPLLDVAAVNWDGLVFGGEVNGYHGLAAELSRYPEGSGGNLSIPYVDWLDALDAADLVEHGAVCDTCGEAGCEGCEALLHPEPLAPLSESNRAAVVSRVAELPAGLSPTAVVRSLRRDMCGKRGERGERGWGRSTHSFEQRPWRRMAYRLALELYGVRRTSTDARARERERQSRALGY